jgi:glycosyltransferase involved in cell wall biosynthesis
MSSPPAVSIVLIFFNEQRFLREAVDSVLAQTDTDWELLLVDDGSSDGSPNVAREYARRDPDRIRCLEHPGHENRGMSASRNLGITAARGEFVTFLDADDVWMPTKLERQVALLRAYPAAGLATGRTEYWHGWTGDPADSARDFVQRLNVPLDAVVPPPKMLTAFLQDELASLSDIVVRRSAIDAVGGYEPPFRGLYEDQVFHAKLCLRYPVVTSSHTGYRYRQHPDSCVQVEGRAGRKLDGRRKFFAWLIPYLEAEHAADRELWRIVKRESLPFRHPTLSRLRDAYRDVRRRVWAVTGTSQPEAR